MFIQGDDTASAGSQYDFGRDLKDGEHSGKILNIEEGRSKTSNNPMITITVGIDTPDGGVAVMDRRVTTGKALVFYYQFLAAVAPEALETIREAGKAGSGVEINHESFVGRTAKLRTKHEEWEGTSRVKVDRWLAHPEYASVAEVPEPAADEPCPF